MTGPIGPPTTITYPEDPIMPYRKAALPAALALMLGCTAAAADSLPFAADAYAADQAACDALAEAGYPGAGELPDGIDHYITQDGPVYAEPYFCSFFSPVPLRPGGEGSPQRYVVDMVCESDADVVDWARLLMAFSDNGTLDIRGGYLLSSWTPDITPLRSDLPDADPGVMEDPGVFYGHYVACR